MKTTRLSISLSALLTAAVLISGCQSSQASQSSQTSQVSQESSSSEQASGSSDSTSSAVDKKNIMYYNSHVYVYNGVSDAGTDSAEKLGVVSAKYRDYVEGTGITTNVDEINVNSVVFADGDKLLCKNSDGKTYVFVIDDSAKDLVVSAGDEKLYLVDAVPEWYLITVSVNGERYTEAGSEGSKKTGITDDSVIENCEKIGEISSVDEEKDPVDDFASNYSGFEKGDSVYRIDANTIAVKCSKGVFVLAK